jgi:exosortase
VLPVSLVAYAEAGYMAIAVLGVLALALDWGIGILIFGLLVLGWGIHPGQNDWVKDLGMVITIFGVVLTLCGWQVMKTAWFPILFLICALPWPGLVYSKIALPLQNLAATVAVVVLNIFGAASEQVGTKIIIDRPFGPSRVLNVAEACAGMRSLMTFISVGGAVAFLSSRPLWQKIIITLSAVPIAIFCNVMRVAGQGLLDRYVSEQLSQSYAHQFVGLVMLVPAFFLILLVGWFLDKIFIEEVEEAEPTTVRAVKRPVAGGAQTVAATTATAPRRPAIAARTETAEEH